MLKSFIFFLLVISILAFILMTQGGYIDYFYEKFTTPKSKSLILGDSRSMQGIQPAVISDYFSKGEYGTPIMNYSFTIAQIAYGPLYNESVKKKLDKSTRNGLFIISVNPWILSTREGDDVDNGIYFEAGMPPYNMNYVDVNPNFEYLVKNFNYFHFRSILRKTSKMHKDGWLEESNLPKDSSMLNTWKAHQIKMYSNYAKKWKKSDFRLNSLEKLISYLNNHGQVVLLRMPVDKKIITIEETYWNGFDRDIQQIANREHIIYINDVSENSHSTKIYKTYDGNHLDKYSGVDFTTSLCDSIVYRSKYLKK